MIEDYINCYIDLLFRKKARERFCELHKLALEVFGTPEKAATFMHRPTANLGGKTPFEVSVLWPTGHPIVKEYIEKISHGLGT